MFYEIYFYYQNNILLSTLTINTMFQETTTKGMLLDISAMHSKKKILYIDMDNVLVDFQSGLDQIDGEKLEEFKGHEDDIPDLFAKMKPMPGAIEAFNYLAHHLNTYILTTALWKNPTAITDKKNWALRYLPKVHLNGLLSPTGKTSTKEIISLMID